VHSLLQHGATARRTASLKARPVGAHGRLTPARVISDGVQRQEQSLPSEAVAQVEPGRASL